MDKIGVALNIWGFSNHGSAFLASIPLEEYAVYIGHTMYCLVLLNIFKK